MLICSVYRAPSANSDYSNNIIDMITYASLENEQLVITGDLNYNYVFDESLHGNPLHFIKTCFNMEQLVSTPKRVTPSHTQIMSPDIVKWMYEHDCIHKKACHTKDFVL